MDQTLSKPGLQDLMQTKARCASQHKIRSSSASSLSPEAQMINVGRAKTLGVALADRLMNHTSAQHTGVSLLASTALLRASIRHCCMWKKPLIRKLKVSPTQQSGYEGSLLWQHCGSERREVTHKCDKHHLNRKRLRMPCIEIPSFQKSS